MLRNRPWPSRSADADAGSVMIAMTVILVVTLLMATTLAMVYSGLNAARNDQDRTNAFQHANAGIDQALQRIDRKLVTAAASPATGYAPITDATNGLIGFTQDVTVGTSTFRVRAVQDPPGQDTYWKVTSTGRDQSGRLRRAIATIAATPIFVNGFVTLQDFYLTGTQTSPVAYDSKDCPTAATSCEINPVPSLLGTNANIDGADATIESFKAKWQGFEMYGRPTQSTADFACAQYRCGTEPKVVARTNQYEAAFPDRAEFTQSCPSGGVIGNNTGAPTTIEPGNYLCTGGLSLTGKIVVGTAGNGTGQVRFWVEGALSMANGAVVNQKKATPKMQFYQPPTTAGGSICGAEVWALINAPSLPVECNGSAQPSIYGAVIAKLHGGTGSHFDFHWDLQSRYAIHNGKYVVKNWRECPPTQPEETADC